MFRLNAKFAKTGRLEGCFGSVLLQDSKIFKRDMIEAYLWLMVKRLCAFLVCNQHPKMKIECLGISG
ncbi:MAG TPA: hypothetical protein DDW21_08350 [Verrucomicrobiales bacterium]|nr:MAG: hypothetical protein CAK88_13625 [Verrucomicrobiae bacterium AMD-G2]HBE23430.1 hypothetical protein [Verrucomicrobiales bacterium]